MGHLHLPEALAELAELPAESRAGACLGLAAAMQQAAAELAEPGATTVFDPLECRASDASHCAYSGRPLLHDQRVCLAALDPEVTCPSAGR
jgi:hypothetical protein